jgi:VWFA-related protein
VTDVQRRHLELSSDDLTVIEDGVEQKVEVFQDAVAPVSIVLTLDTSGSMRRDAPDVIETARDFVASLRPEDSLAVQLFSDQVVLAHDFTKNREGSAAAIAMYHASGGTALYDALAEGLNRLKRVQGRRVVVVLTDGRDENNAGTAAGSVRTFDDVATLIKEADATIFPVGLGPRVDRTTLERLAGLSGGEAYFPLEVSALREDYLRIVENLRRRYVLSYTSTNPLRNGSWRDVQIGAKSSDIVISSRGGYFAPQQ